MGPVCDEDILVVKDGVFEAEPVAALACEYRCEGVFF